MLVLTGLLVVVQVLLGGAVCLLLCSELGLDRSGLGGLLSLPLLRELSLPILSPIGA